jgi:site-specific DNA-methyltransferase (adenine-specific)
MSEIKLYHGDCLEVMKEVADKSVDMILCDLPFGVTSSKWDKIISFDELWKHYKRIVKPKGAILLFGVEPFTSQLILSNLEMFKYNWYWNKNCNGGFVNAKLKPMNTIEVISVFSYGKTSNGNSNNMLYYPQGLIKCNKQRKMGNKQKEDNTYARKSNIDSVITQEWTNYPRNLITFQREGKCIHPCQKPTDLLEYLIKTYTLEDETVLDNCMGSGSTGVACINTNRNFIGIELDDNYFKIAEDRINKAKESIFEL